LYSKAEYILHALPKSWLHPSIISKIESFKIVTEYTVEEKVNFRRTLATEYRNITGRRTLPDSKHLWSLSGDQTSTGGKDLMRKEIWDSVLGSFAIIRHPHLYVGFEKDTLIRNANNDQWQYITKFYPRIESFLKKLIKEKPPGFVNLDFNGFGQFVRTYEKFMRRLNTYGPHLRPVIAITTSLFWKRAKEGYGLCGSLSVGGKCLYMYDAEKTHTIALTQDEVVEYGKAIRTQKMSSHELLVIMLKRMNSLYGFDDIEIFERSFDYPAAGQNTDAMATVLIRRKM